MVEGLDMSLEDIIIKNKKKSASAGWAYPRFFTMRPSHGGVGPPPRADKTNFQSVTNPYAVRSSLLVRLHVPANVVADGQPTNSGSAEVVSITQGRIVGQGQDRGGDTAQRGSGNNAQCGSGRSRARPQKVSAADLDADLEKYRLERMHIK
ncbi:THO complex subunit 4A [Tanacetum coccineum]